jgi:hypothetical protein
MNVRTAANAGAEILVHVWINIMWEICRLNMNQGEQKEIKSKNCCAADRVESVEGGQDWTHIDFRDMGAIFKLLPHLFMGIHSTFTSERLTALTDTFGYF